VRPSAPCGGSGPLPSFPAIFSRHRAPHFSCLLKVHHVRAAGAHAYLWRRILFWRGGKIAAPASCGQTFPMRFSSSTSPSQHLHNPRSKFISRQRIHGPFNNSNAPSNGPTAVLSASLRLTAGLAQPGSVWYSRVNIPVSGTYLHTMSTKVCASGDAQLSPGLGQFKAVPVVRFSQPLQSGP